MADSPSTPPLDPDAWPAPEPAAGFVDRVLARLDEVAAPGQPASAPPPSPPAPSAPRRAATARVVVLAAASGALAAAIATVLVSRQPSPDVAPRVVAVGSHAGSAERATHRLGERGVAVAEAGAALSWHIGLDGDAEIAQQRGSVFYRVEHDPAHPFVVTTPHGKIRVTGTCFTVRMRGGASEVQVHEGSVAAEAARAIAQLVAGERVALTDRGIERLADHAASSAVDVRALPPAPTAATTAASANAPKIDIDRATLLKWAETCHVRGDLPPLEDTRPSDAAAWQAYARQIGASDTEMVAVRSAFAEVERDAYAAARDIYAQTTGDRDGIEGMTIDRIGFEIARVSDYSEQYEVLQRLSAERAGLQDPPPVGHMLPLEQLLRLITVQGDRFEAAIARRLGTARARAMRERNQGWPDAHDWEGCPAARP
jgi:hypothetical protein